MNKAFSNILSLLALFLMLCFTLSIKGSCPSSIQIERDSLLDVFIEKTSLHNDGEFRKYPAYYAHGYSFLPSTLSREEFEKRKKKYYKEGSSSVIITDPQEAKKLLGNLLIWDEPIEDNTDDVMIASVKARDGRELWSCIDSSKPDVEEYFECSLFSCYYPNEDILLLEGGHTSDQPFDLVTGNSGISVASPMHMHTPATCKFQVRTFDGGQGSSEIMLFEKQDGEYIRILNFHSIWGEPNYFSEDTSFFWGSDSELYFNLWENHFRKLVIEPYQKSVTKDNLIDSNGISEFSLDMKSLIAPCTKYNYRSNYIYDKDETTKLGQHYSFMDINVDVDIKRKSADQKYTDSMHRVVIGNSYYQTAKLAGVGSTIGELKKAYPDMKFYYLNEISPFCWGETEQLKNVVFRLEYDNTLWEQAEKLQIAPNEMRQLSHVGNHVQVDCIIVSEIDSKKELFEGFYR